MHPTRHRGGGGPWARARAELLALLIPTHCPGCGHPDVTICAPCRALLTGPGRPVQEITGSRPPAWPPGLEGSAATLYAGPVRRVLHAWKDRGRHDLTAVVAAGLVPSLTAWARATAPGALVVVPVPSSTANRRRRGVDLLRQACGQAAAVVAARPGTAHLTVAPVLRQVPKVSDQRGLGARDRVRNIRGGLVCTGRVRGSAIVLVDDVVTTGASTAEAARVLGAAGADVLAVVALAATPIPG